MNSKPLSAVLVLGTDGMLGHRVEHSLRKAGIEAVTTSRLGDAAKNRIPFNAITDSVADLLSRFASRTSLIVNAIGVIKPQINEQSELSRLNALEVNAVFPHKLALAASRIGVRVVQIATDCVFSGDKGSYVETSPHDAVDLYGQSKSMGEVSSPMMMHLRCSIVGTERSSKRSLWEWVRNQPDGATVRGFRNHLWNGITTDAFGRLFVAILEQDLHCAGVHHIVPNDQVSKAQLVEVIAHKSGRKDIKIEVEDVYPPVNRTLATIHPEFNEKLWTSAGYAGAPNIKDLISDYEL